MVLTVDRGRLHVLIEDRTIIAMKARELGRKGVVVGDRVAVVGDLSGAKDTLARVVRVEARSSVLRRTADDDDPFERVVVANAEQLAIVTALADPEPRPRLIDRCLVAAFDAGLEPLLVLTKSDLAPGRRPPGDLRGRSACSYVVTNRDELASPDRPSDRVRERLKRTGSRPSWATPASARRRWSTPWCRSANGPPDGVNAVTGRGRHTTTSALALPLPGRRGLGDRHAGRALLRTAPCRPHPGHRRLPRSANPAH
jgi:ribosome biogenesis GTPase